MLGTLDIFLPIFDCVEQGFCSFLLCSGGQIVHRNALSALKGDLTLSVPFGDLQTANEAVMGDHALCTVFACSLDLINLDLFNKLAQDHRIERFHLHKAPHRFEEVILGLSLFLKTVKLLFQEQNVILGFDKLNVVLMGELHEPFVRNLAVYVVLIDLFIPFQRLKMRR